MSTINDQLAQGYVALDAFLHAHSGWTNRDARPLTHLLGRRGLCLLNPSLS
ncbi:MAG: hypothetical protein ACRD6N_01625 [Pyrinomonadaceae bacterium]